MPFVRHSWVGWPLYLIVDPLADRFPSEGWFLRLPRRDLALVTPSFAFAHLVAEKLNIHLSTPMQILRVNYNHYFTVTSESITRGQILWPRRAVRGNFYQIHIAKCA